MNHISGHINRVWGVLLFAMIGAIVSVSGFGEKSVVALVFIFIFIGFFVLWRLALYEEGVPLYNAGFVLILVTILYSVYPLLSYWVSGFQFTVVSDNRLFVYAPFASDMAYFSMHHLVYLLSLVFGFFLFLTKKQVRAVPILRSEVSRRSIYAVLAVYILAELFLLMVSAMGLTDLYLVKQLSHHVASFRFVMLLALLYIGTKRWEVLYWRGFVWLVLSYQLLLMFMQLSGRTYFFLILMAFFMFYHKNVFKLPFLKSIVVFFVMLFVFIVWGYVKTSLIYSMGGVPFISGSNEFTSLFGTAYDLFYRKNISLSLPEIPLTVLYNDLFLLIPKQLLPFEKWSTSQWYLEVIGLRGTGVGMMFGVISQGVIGGGLVELAIRGGVTGVLLSVLHGWYRRNSQSLVVNVAYVFIAVRSYYTFRAGTGYIFYDIIYQLIPALVLFFIVKGLFVASAGKEN